MVRVPMAELVGEMSGVGEPARGMLWDTPRRDRKARWNDALRRFRRRSQTRMKHMIKMRARTEQIATAALPCPVNLLPDVVDDAVAVAEGLPVATVGAEVGSEAATAGVGFDRIVAAVGWVLLV